MTDHAVPVWMLAIACIATPGCAHAQRAAEPELTFSSQGQDLESALLSLSRQSGKEVIFASDAVAGKVAPRLSGRFTAEQAARLLVKGSGLSVRLDGDTILIVAGPDPTGAPPSTEVVVTGSRIRGGQSYAPVTTVSREALRAQGQTDLGEAVRTIPQNFGGGQSPYIGLGAEDFGSDNLNSGSSINLRGLGADATLTLLNGHRLAYDGVAEGVDVSAIPLAAIDRIEVVADGASAIYGSDAVAGVVNVVLRRDYSGLQTSARLGGATDGGDRQQQLEAVAGTTWGGADHQGGVVATVSYDHNSAITADQRHVSNVLDASSVILPRSSHIGAVMSAHQAFGSGVNANLDVLYSRRTAFSAFSNTTDANYLAYGIDRRPSTESIAMSPSLTFDLGPKWAATIVGTYGRDHTRYRTRYFQDGGVIADYRGAYNNVSVGAEGSAEGALIALPAGDARLALGLGYRRVSLVSQQSDGVTSTTGIKGNRDSYYAFGELNVPLVGTGNARPGIDRLSANVAGRFEHYPRIGDVFTPKLGLLYAPTRFLEIRGTWGKSFKAPTLFQLYEAQGALLYTADTFGGVGDPAAATAIYAYGGNPDLTPQRATSWSAGAVLVPFADRALTVEGTYFRTRYTDRIVAPITSATTALSDPLVADLIQLAPDSGAIAALLAGTQLGLVNYSGVTYEPANVVAIIDDRNRNVAAERISGVDLSASYKARLSSSATLALTAAGTLLRSHRQLSPGQPATVLAGTIFNPPHLRVRGGASLSDGPLTASGFVTRAGGVDDDRFSPSLHVSGQTTVDLATGYAFPAQSGPLHGLGVQLSILNAFNDQPDRIRTSYAFYTPYDATNYSPVGRLISFTLTKAW